MPARMGKQVGRRSEAAKSCFLLLELISPPLTIAKNALEKVRNCESDETDLHLTIATRELTRTLLRILWTVCPSASAIIHRKKVVDGHEARESFYTGEVAMENDQFLTFGRACLLAAANTGRGSGPMYKGNAQQNNRSPDDTSSNKARGSLCCTGGDLSGAPRTRTRPKP